MRRQGIENQSKESKVLLEDFFEETECHPCLVLRPTQIVKPEEVVQCQKSEEKKPVAPTKCDNDIDSDRSNKEPINEDVKIEEKKRTVQKLKSTQNFKSGVIPPLKN